MFSELNGVVSVVPGYAGGDTENPSYRAVCGGKTGHAEVVNVQYDPSLISYDILLTVFFGTHDPTTLNRQGADSGTQYRSVILYTNETQKAQAEAFLEELRKSSPVVTELAPLDKFYQAEADHHNFYLENRGSMYCKLVIDPKVQKVRKEFAKHTK